MKGEYDGQIVGLKISVSAYQSLSLSLSLSPSYCIDKCASAQGTRYSDECVVVGLWLEGLTNWQRR